jgi:DNA-binding CsgD family transcriptional regulator/tetratricopeptide (TPR) repeat protein
MATALSASPLLERDDSLARLRGASTEAVAGHGQMILVMGEAGVGKTALVQHMTESCADLRVWTGSCERLFTARPLGPLADIASKTSGHLGDVVGRGAPVHDVFAVLLQELRSTPTLLVIEDVHWADDATLDVVSLLAGRMRTTLSLAVVTCRDELAMDHPVRLVLGGLVASGVERMRVLPLSLTAVRALAASSGVDADELFRTTSGNPFFVTEVLAAPGMELPPSVRDAVLARVATLDSGGRGLLEALSVVSGTISTELAAALGGEHTDRLGACLSAGMLVASGDGITFRHELARTAIVDCIDPLRRVELHRTALEVLRETSADPARLAHHAESAGDASAMEEYASRAAREALARGAHREAAAQFQRALKAKVDIAGARRAEMLELGAHEWYLTDHFDEAITWLEQAIRLRRSQGDLRAEADAHRLLSAVQRCGGHRVDADVNGRRAVELLEREPPGPELAAAHANMAMLALNSSDLDVGMTAARQALDLAARCGQRDVLVHAMNSLGFLRVLAGDEDGLADLVSSLELSLAEGRDEHAGRAFIHLADIAQRHRRWDLIDRYFGQGMEYCAEHALDLWARYLAVYHARTLLDRGRWTEAVAAIPANLYFARTPLARVTALVVLGLVHARRGDAGQWSALDEAGELAESSGELQWIAPVTAARLEAAWLGDRDPVEAEAAGAVLQECIDRHAGWWAGEIAWWRRRAGFKDAVPTCAAEPWTLLLSGQFRKAAAEWHRLSCPYEEGAALMASDDEQDLRHAFERFDSLGATPAATAVTRRMRVLGVSRVPRGSRATTRANPAGLTTREMEVLRLIARGLANAEIAVDLVVSTKTVDHHVSSVLAKLGVTSRLAAAREASRLGIHDEEAAATR